MTQSTLSPEFVVERIAAIMLEMRQSGHLVAAGMASRIQAELSNYDLDQVFAKAYLGEPPAGVKVEERYQMLNREQGTNWESQAELDEYEARLDQQDDEARAALSPAPGVIEPIEPDPEPIVIQDTGINLATGCEDEETRVTRHNAVKPNWASRSVILIILFAFTMALGQPRATVYGHAYPESRGKIIDPSQGWSMIVEGPSCDGAKQKLGVTWLSESPALIRIICSNIPEKASAKGM